MRYDTEPVKTRLLRDRLSNQGNFRFGERSFKNVDLLAQRIFEYFALTAEEFKELKELKEEIKHFKNIKVTLEDISEIQRKVERVKDYPSQLKELQKQYGKVSAEEYMQMAQNLKNEEDFETNHKKIKIKYIANHYYIPLILSDEERLDYIKHIIKTPSEVKFINDLEGYLARSDNKFKEFDWWLFSKLDESLDDIYIPYYNPNANKISKFYPDFIFWLLKGNEYLIVFVDPKGTEHTSAYRKIDGYRDLFEETGKEKGFYYNGFKVKIKLRLRPEDVSKTLTQYRQYWFENIENILVLEGD